MHVCGLSSANAFWTKVPASPSQRLPPSSSGKRRRDRSCHGAEARRTGQGVEERSVY